MQALEEKMHLIIILCINIYAKGFLVNIALIYTRETTSVEQSVVLFYSFKKYICLPSKIKVVDLRA